MYLSATLITETAHFYLQTDKMLQQAADILQKWKASA
jgi:hypothetical protein